MKLFIVLLVAVVMIISTSLHAETKYERLYNKCIDEAGTINNTVMSGCSEQTSLVAKKDITYFYQQIEKKLSHYDDAIALLDLLASSQKVWVTYRDNNCALSNRIAMQSPYCLMQMNAQRAEALKTLAE
jgi:uncharacterized protein YecT (DUF1311 family)